MITQKLWPRARRETVYPFFLPFAGCRKRCVFCSQEAQTGVKLEADLASRLAACETDLAFRAKLGKPAPELAFYGGSFTAAPETVFRACLTFAKKNIAQGLIRSFRCSTRPDCVSPSILAALKMTGCETVELGAQSFSDAALTLSGRGHDGDVTRRAVLAVKEAGLNVGVQLMPGMPCCDPGTFLRDVELAVSLGASFLRFYPCLVLANTPLANLWRSGRFSPWPLELAIETLSEGWLLAARANVPVIRMGLAPQPGFMANVLAGPAHPSLGSRVLALAFFKTARAMLADASGHYRLTAPAACQGFLRGWRGELLPAWSEIGVNPDEVVYTADNFIRLERVG